MLLAWCAILGCARAHILSRLAQIGFAHAQGTAARAMLTIFLWRMTLDIFPLDLLHGIMLDPALWGYWERTEWGCGASIYAALPVNAACLGWVGCPCLEMERTSDADSLRNGMARRARGAWYSVSTSLSA
ncbi:hypothetical protein B0H13DRAFT_2355483 [Mycena leptocephala]|nr:hypothetical protein B0H13DRAFT_2355483 [Mycena leptocephala]